MYIIVYKDERAEFPEIRLNVLHHSPISDNKIMLWIRRHVTLKNILIIKISKMYSVYFIYPSQ
jgi:hypothetical protein